VHLRKILPALLFALAAHTTTVNAQNTAANEGLTESIHRVALSRGVELPVLTSTRTGSRPTIAVLLFAGYPGILKLQETAGAIRFDLGGNFLIRARRFLNSDKVFTVAVDCPVDQWSFCSDVFRSSSQHAADIAQVVASVKSTYGADKVYIAGTSYGTVSTALLARALGGTIDGAIHTASITHPRSGPQASGTALRSFDWSKATVPQLFVHHKDDPCDMTRYSGVVEQKGEIPLITVEGSSNPRGNACDALTAHGFVGRERVTMTAIHDWITERKTPASVGAAQ
jgi:Serine aminopeptidase, S33